MDDTLNNHLYNLSEALEHIEQTLSNIDATLTNNLTALAGCFLKFLDTIIGEGWESKSLKSHIPLNLVKHLSRDDKPNEKPKEFSKGDTID